MKKSYFLLLFFLVIKPIFAQVGINTTTPNAQLEIKSSDQAAPSNTDGILIPKVDFFPATNPTAAQQGMLVYLTTTSGTNLPGFYYWDNSGTPSWKPIIGTNVGTLDQAYDFGGAGNGKTITADAGAVTIDGTDGLVSTGVYTSGTIAPSGPGTRMVWNPRKAAFRAGDVDGTQWDDENIGIRSVAFGLRTTASGNSSSAFGQFSIASGAVATAFGRSTASGLFSTSFGYSSTASGNSSSSFGQFSVASGDVATAFGRTTASGLFSTSFGYLSTASGVLSNSFGYGNFAKSYAETVFGVGATDYTPTVNGDIQVNAPDRLFVIGNAIDANNNDFVDESERSDALIILKNGLTRLPSTTNAMINAADGKTVVTKEWVQDNNSTLSWGLTGNAGTNPATNFIGTTDNVDLVFRRGTIQSGRIGDTNTFFGKDSGSANTGNSNTFIGERAGIDNVSGTGNTFIGRHAGANGISGNYNIFIGYGSGLNNTGLNNVIIGAFASQNTTGSSNVFVGNLSAGQNTTGSRNTVLGHNAEVGAGNLTNATAIGSNSRVDTSNSLVLGSIGTLSSTNVGIGTAAPDRKLEVSGTGTQYARITSTSSLDVGFELKRVGSDWQMRNDTGDLVFAQSNDDLATVTDVVRVGGGSFTPVTDNLIQLGQNSRRWLSVHAVNGVIQTSDATDKKEMLPLSYGLEKIKSLRPISFQWKDTKIDNSSTHLGFVAQEVQQVLPEVVIDHDWKEIPESQEKTWKKTEKLGMKYAEIIPVLV